jgi:hypothetical protein
LVGDFAAPKATLQQPVIKPVRFKKPNRFDSGGYKYISNFPSFENLESLLIENSALPQMQPRTGLNGI